MKIRRQLVDGTGGNGRDVVRGKQIKVASLCQMGRGKGGACDAMLAPPTECTEEPLLICPPHPILTFCEALTQVEVTKHKAAHELFPNLFVIPWEVWSSLPLTCLHPHPNPQSVRLNPPSVNKHESGRWYERSISKAGISSKVFHNRRFSTGRCALLECVAFCFSKNKKNKNKTAKITL